MAWRVEGITKARSLPIEQAELLKTTAFNALMLPSNPNHELLTNLYKVMEAIAYQYKYDSGKRKYGVLPVQEEFTPKLPLYFGLNLEDKISS